MDAGPVFAFEEGGPDVGLDGHALGLAGVETDVDVAAELPDLVLDHVLGNLSGETPSSIDTVRDVLDQLFATPQAGIIEQGAANLIENLVVIFVQLESAGGSPQIVVKGRFDLLNVGFGRGVGTGVGELENFAELGF